jgi:peptide-methionine (S)-S-oxide reductase
MAHTQERATFAGGCFWCLEPVFRNVPGILNVVVGYANGRVAYPSYEEVSLGITGHTEAIQLVYDPQRVDYRVLARTFFHQIDPTDLEGQFADRGSQYRPVIYFHTPSQKQLAQEVEEEIEKSGKFKGTVKVPIEPFQVFYPAEEYHQQFYVKNADQYHHYRKASGREAFIRSNWGEGETVDNY